MKEIVIFTDGASRGNPGPGGWGTIIVFPQKKDDILEIRELGGREKHTTNNQMELTAVCEALKYVGSSITPPSNLLILYTDSSYVINGITKWVMSWQNKKWMTTAKTEVMNRELWEKLIKVSQGKDIKWKYIGGHRGIAGNERCDEIATEFADGKKVKLYNGSIEKYPLDILNFSLDETKSKKRTTDRSRSKAPAYSYLSKLDGKIMKHSTWPECEKRVKGKSGARFKKALSAEDEGEILREWSRS